MEMPKIILNSVLLITLSLLLPGCATIFEGTSQSISVSTNPSGANCTINRNGSRIGQVNPTPGSIHVDKSKDDLTVSCEHAGFLTANVSRSSRFQGTTFGNIIIGGLAGVVVDLATGADFEYPADIQLSLASAPEIQPPISLLPSSPRSDLVRTFASAAITPTAPRGPRPDLMIKGTDVDPSVAKRLQGEPPSGVFLSDVIPGGVGSVGGLQAGDVIMALNGVRIGSVEDLQRELDRLHPGVQVNAAVWRANRQFPVIIQF
jgi:hypothetical protein